MVDDAVNILKEYISMENVFFIPFLICFGRCIKKSMRIDNTLIPNILGVLGIFLCSLVSFSQNSPTTWVNWVLLVTVGIGQGVCVSGVAVYINQWFKQNQKYQIMRSFDGDVSMDDPEAIAQSTKSPLPPKIRKQKKQAVCQTCGNKIGGAADGD